MGAAVKSNPLNPQPYKPKTKLLKNFILHNIPIHSYNIAQFYSVNRNTEHRVVQANTGVKLHPSDYSTKEGGA